MKKALLIILAGIGGLSVLVIGVLFIITVVAMEPEDFDETNEIESVTGKYIASIYTRMGGGAAGWCEKGVIIYPKELQDAETEELVHKWTVFDGRCRNNININWAEGDLLRITSDGTQLPNGVTINVSN